MNFLASLFRWSGTISRRQYFVTGVVLLAIKWQLDRYLAATFLGRRWSPFDLEDIAAYFVRWGNYLENPRGSLVLLAAALPFMWCGIALTLRRLRSAGLPSPLALLFFMPFVKWFLFVVLSVAPARDMELVPELSHRKPGWFARIVPVSNFGAATVAVAMTVSYGVVIVWIGTTQFRDYGWSLFVGLPFCQGFVAAHVLNFHQSRSVRASIGCAMLSVTLLGGALLLFAFEGIICVLMAAPLAYLMAFIGALFGQYTSFVQWPDGPRGNYTGLILFSLPLLMGFEHARPPTLPLLEVTSSIEIDAPPSRVWQHVITFSDLPPPDEWVFKTGVAYPVRARIAGAGVGAIRRCEFSTGAFIEPITVWDEPHTLAFSVLENPAPMQEWTPYKNVHPPHLHGFMCSQRGQFRLVELPGGRTRLEGTTWYHHHMWPAHYWQMWSDQIIHIIHMRVLRHVKELAEK